LIRTEEAHTAALGDAVVDFTRIHRNWEFTYSYGLSDKVSFGILIPFNDVKNNVSAYLDTTTADVGRNPLYTLAGFNPADPATYPIIPVAFGGQPLSTADIMALLGPGLDVDNNGTVEGPEPVGYGLDPVEDWSGSDIGDIELVAKYKFYEKDNWRMAFSGGLKLPTGKTDDPDNLVDIASGDGQTDILLKLNTDYTGVEKLFLNATVKVSVQLPAKETLRVLDDPDVPLTANKEKVDRDLGDIVQMEMMGNYSISREWSVGLKYRFTRKFKDEVDGNLGYNYSALEDGTDTISHMGWLSIGYSTVKKYLDKEASVPFNVGMSYRNRFAGKNGVTNSEYISLSFGIYF